MAYWLDYSAAKLSGPMIRNAGYTGVIRYIDAPDRLRTKHTNKAEYDSHIASGLTVRLVFQNTTTDADGGYAAGVANAQRALAGANYLGYSGVIFFCNDRTTVPNVQAWRDYLRGAATVLGKARVGAYGFANALNAAIGYASAFWQAGRLSDRVAHANYWQDNNTQVTVAGVLCDRNVVWSDYNLNVGGGSTGGASDKFDEEEYEMQPVALKPSAVDAWHTFIWDGRKAVLNIVSDGEDIFTDPRVYCWGPNGGMDGGYPTAAIDAVPNGWRITVNKPGQFDVPAGTTRVALKYSTNANALAQIVAV
jgi:hypothetical protein